MVRQPVQQRRCQRSIPKHLPPTPKLQVGISYLEFETMVDSFRGGPKQ